mmetsp:Transcript_87908/g.174497  ORF Transcript_87908/g.174497 Transcript_87908/m.174497 type:complete len:203 (+) Transcript_87908:899-1507(+)
MLRVAITIQLLFFALCFGLFFFSAPVLFVKGVNGALRILRHVVVHKRKFASALVVLKDARRSDGTKFAEFFMQLFLVPIIWKTPDVQVCETRSVGLVSFKPLLEGVDLHGLLTNLHAVYSLNRLLRSLFCLIMNKTITLGLARVITGYFARKNVPEQAKCVIQSLVVDAAVQVLDKYIPDTALPQTRVPLAPHNATGSALDA